MAPSESIASDSLNTLTSAYGFPRERALEALAAIHDKSDVSLAVAWLLEHGEEDRGGAVQFIHCPHLEEDDGPDALPLVEPSTIFSFDMPCALGCNGKENWVCLVCAASHCSRYQKKHALKHKDESGHAHAISLSDLSVWCYKCDAYIEHPRCAPLVSRFKHLKFGEGSGSGSSSCSAGKTVAEAAFAGPRGRVRSGARSDTQSGGLPAIEEQEVVGEQQQAVEDDDGTGGVQPSPKRPSCPLPAAAPLPALEAHWAYRCALLGEDTHRATGTDSLLVDSARQLATTLVHKKRDERLELVLPDGEELIVCGLSVSDISQSLQRFLMHAKIDLLHNVGGGCTSTEARAALKQAVDQLQSCLDIERGGVPWMRVSLVGPLGSRRCPCEEGGASPVAAAASRSPALQLGDIGTLLREAPPKSIIVMVGAGMSVSAGIPDFRSPGTGLYSQLQGYNLPRPEAIFDLQFFATNPAPFYRLCRELWPGRYAPTAAHKFVKSLHDRGKLLRCFTQNIDSLEAEVGLPPEMVVPAHGNFDGAYVMRRHGAAGRGEAWESSALTRGEAVDVGELREAIMAGEDGWKRLNAKHNGLVKPSITFFGEPLSPRFFERVQTDFPHCRLLLIFGTSLKVQPFASLVNEVPCGTPRLLVNRDVVGEDLGLDFGGAPGATDVFYRGDCDDGAAELDKMLSTQT